VDYDPTCMKWFPWLTRVFLAAALALGLVGCKPAASTTATGGSSAAETPREYSVRGVVRRVEPERRSVVVKHEEIPGFMPAMTMPFDVQEPKELNGLKPGDQISFRMLVTTNDGWIDRIQVVGSDTNAVATPPPVRITSSVPLLEAGSLLPDYTLTNELGRVIRLSEFRGQVLAFTFIFTRCPYPDFCPRMTDLFARAQKHLAGEPDAPKNVRFLSISFDPEHDTPELLRAYAERHNYDPSRWTLATGAWDQLEPLTGHFGLIFGRDVPPEKMEHNLRTVVVRPSGKIQAVLPSNEWQSEDLIREIRAAAAEPTAPARGR
jgi:protein SCO1/2